MSRWWRAHDEAVDDPKLQTLPAELFRAWFNLCCLTSANGGVLPPIDHIAFKLRVSSTRANAFLVGLIHCGLIDRLENGQHQPHNWDVRQFKSDVSTPRVNRFRKRQRNVSSTVSETAPETDTEAETDSTTSEYITTDIGAVADATRPKINEEFEKFWKAYPKREGANPRKPAKEAFLAAIKRGATADEILGAVQQYAEKDQNRVGTPYIAQARTWLGEDRWRDYNAPAASVEAMRTHLGLPSSEELREKWKNAENRQTKVVSESP